MKKNPKADLVTDTLEMATWPRKLGGKVLMHSGQEIQYTPSDGRRFLLMHNLDAIVSPRSNYHDSKLAESFLVLLTTDRIERHAFNARNETRRDIQLHRVLLQSDPAAWQHQWRVNRGA